MNATHRTHRAHAGTRRPHVRFPIFRRLAREGWRSLLAWLVGIAAVLGLYLPLYPSMRTPELSALIKSLPETLTSVIGYDQITTGAGYTQATFFGLLGFVLLIIACTARGAAFLAGAEESGRLELFLSHGVGRRQYALEAAAALLAAILTFALAVCLLIGALNGPAELDLEAGNVVAAVAAWAGLGMFSGTAALAAGALTGRTAWAIGAGAGIAVVGYALDALGKNSASLDWLRVLSPYHWAYGQHPLTNGADWLGLALLWGLSAMLVGVSVAALSRRDILG